MIDFINEPEKKQEDPFDAFYADKMEQIVVDDAQNKDKYHHKFWMYLLSLLFINSANILIVLFGNLMSGRAVSFEQLFLVFVLSLALIYMPVWKYRRSEKTNIVELFLSYYGDWKYNNKTVITEEKLPIVPPHESAEISQEISGKSNETEIVIKSVCYKKKSVLNKLTMQRVCGRGLRLTYKLSEPQNITLLMFDKDGFYRKKKYENLEPVNNINVPAANYFYIFIDDANVANSFVRATLFERLLDLKEIFSASQVYFYLKGDIIEIFLNNCSLYQDDYRFWGRCANKEKLQLLHRQFDEILVFASAIQEIIEVNR